MNENKPSLLNMRFRCPQLTPTWTLQGNYQKLAIQIAAP